MEQETQKTTKKPAKKSVKETSFGSWLLKNIILAAILFIAIAILSGFILRSLTNHGKEITVPDLANLTVNEARHTASSLGLRTEVIDSVFIRRMGRGLVYTQNPRAGASVKKGRKIQLVINSLSPKKIQMPNLVGYTLRQANAELMSKGLALGTITYVNDIATNIVISQLYNNREISPGQQIESGTEIDLVVGLSSDMNKTYVPNVKGMKYVRASEAIHENSLNIKKAVFDESIVTYADSLDAVVSKQDPDPSDNAVLMGSEVTIYLSKDKMKRK